MDVLVCGGAGYIGSHMAKMLMEAGHRVVVFDNLSQSTRKDIFNTRVKLVVGNLLNEKELYLLFSRYHFDVVFHFANYSPNNRHLTNAVKQDTAYIYKNNVVGTLNLLTQMRQFDVKKIVYASSADIYQNNGNAQLSETTPVAASNAYEMSVIAIERMLQDFHQSYGMNSACMRFYHAEGICEDERYYHWLENKNSQLVKLIQSMSNNNGEFTEVDEFNDRGRSDYLHVFDVCRAHINAMHYLQESPGAHAFNLGTEGGYSITEILEATRKLLNLEPSHTEEPIPNDVATKTLSSDKSKKKLGWQTTMTLLDTLTSLSTMLAAKGGNESVALKRKSTLPLSTPGKLLENTEADANGWISKAGQNQPGVEKIH